MLYYFAGFSGYLLVGYYLNKYNRMSLAKSWLIAIPLFIVGFIATFIGFRKMMADANATEEMIELFWTYCSPNVLLMTIDVFIFVQKIRIRSAECYALLSNLTK